MEDVLQMLKVSSFGRAKLQLSPNISVEKSRLSRSFALPRLRLEKFLNFLKHFDEPINFRRRIVKIKTGARRRFNAEFFHERLIAMMPAAQCNSMLIGNGYNIMRMNSVK